MRGGRIFDTGPFFCETMIIISLYVTVDVADAF